MTRILRPDSNPTRTSALNAIKSRRDALPIAELPFTNAAIQWLDTFYPDFNLAVSDLNRTRAEQTAQTVVVAQLRPAARMWVNHGYQGVVNACIRGEYLRTVLSYYGLDNNAMGGPDMDTDQRIINAYRAYVDGEAARIAAGGTAMPFPAQADIALRADAFEAANIVQGTLKNAFDDAQEKMAQLNVETDQLLLRLWNEIEAVYDKGDKPSMRRKAREWGVVYVPSPGQTPTPDDWSAMGTVRSSEGDVLKGAQASYVGTDIIATSNAEGVFYMPAIEPGTYTLQVALPGYMPYEQPIVITGDEVLRLEVILSPMAPPPPPMP